MLGAVRQTVRDLYKRLPANRRLKGLGGLDGRALLVARTALAPLLAIDVTLTDSNGVRYRVTRDHVDANVVNDLTGPRRQMWFPEASGRSSTDLVLDVGGHHGHYLAAAAQHWPDAKLITVEPSRPAVELIQAHVDMNGLGQRVEIVAAAIGDETGKADLYHDPEGSWGSSLHDVGGAVTEPVDTVRLAEVLKGREPDVVKCNAEGGEYSVVPQILGLGLRPHLMVVMLHPEFGDASALVQTLLDGGFVVDRFGSDHRPAIHARPI